MTNGRVEVITSVQRRRRWSISEKQLIIAASMKRAAASAVAREAGIHVSQLFRWRQELCRRDAASSTFAAVMVSAEPVSTPALTTPSGVIDLEFASGVRLRITGAVDASTLSAVVATLVQGERRR
jgi:transposase